MDANALKSGEDFGKLRDTYVIFITENDVMGRGQEVYSYLRIEENCGDKLLDGTHIIYVNGATRSETEIGKLIHDFLCRNPEEMHFDILRKRIEARGKLEGRREGERKGRREGKRETMLATAMRMLKDGALALKDIARYSGLTLAQVKKLQMEL